MPSFVTVRTALTATVAGASLALTGLVAAPGPAHAANANGQLTASRSVSEFGPATCTATNLSSSESGPFSSNGVTVSKSTSGTATLVDDADNTDTQSIAQSVTAKVRAKEASGRLTSVTLDADFSTTFDIAQGADTDCDARSSLVGQAQYEAVLAAPQWVTVRAEDLPPGATFAAQFFRTAPASPEAFQVVQLVGTQKGRVSAEVLLPAGTYAVISALAVTWIGPQTASDPTVFSASPVATTTFEKVGSAKARADGAAKKFVATDKAVKCTKAKLGAKFTGAAGKVRGGVIEKAIFRVNGKKVKTVKKPKKGHKVKLKKVPGPVDTHLKVTVRYARGGTATLTRTYWSCA